MNNIANIQKLHYCDKKCSNNARCSNIATWQVKTKKKGDEQNIIAPQQWGYRCDEHETTPTSNMVVVESNPFDQGHSLTRISEFLHSLIGKNIVSKIHTARQLKVKYVKPNTGGVMCFQEHSKKWKFVYYEQITEIVEP